MAFVMEKIETAGQTQEFAQLGLVSPLTGRAETPRRWLVDRDRGLYFINFGGGSSELPYFLVLAAADGARLHAQGRESSRGPWGPNAVEVSWNIESIEIPAAFAARSDELQGQLREALNAYGSLGNADVVKRVDVVTVVPKLV